jgi:hypothetical protein
MRLVTTLLLLLTILASPGGAVSKRKLCAQACGSLIAGCVARNEALGDFRRACKAAVLRQCRKDGPALCAATTTTSTTTTSSTTTTTQRFVDNGDGTVTDHATGLQWEKKDGIGGGETPGNPHDVDNLYTWSFSGTAPDGDVFMSFLARLSDCASSDGTTVLGGFAGHCDWRLPTVSELQTILLEPFQCGTNPCIAPVFGATVGGPYWSATSYTNPDGAWVVFFNLGDMDYISKDFPLASVRAVRSGS